MLTETGNTSKATKMKTDITHHHIAKYCKNKKMVLLVGRPVILSFYFLQYLMCYSPYVAANNV